MWLFAKVMTGMIAVSVCTAPLGAQCDSGGHGPPLLANVAATSSTLTFSWILSCTNTPFPTTMQIRQGGTPQRSWQDGTLLGTESLQLLQNGGGVTALNLTPDTLYSNLRVCAVYADGQSPCTDPRAEKTSGGPPGGPFNFSATPVSWNEIKLTWQNLPGTTRLELTWTPGNRSMNFGGQLPTFENVSGLMAVTQYTFKLCQINQNGNKNCAQAAATTLAPPPAPLPFVPPSSVTASWTGPTQITVT